MGLNYEQLNWVCNISQDEGNKIISLLETGKWIMVWDEETHAFVLTRTEKVIDILTEEVIELDSVK